jgi:uncharacterized cupredoxin-like copper-binding protein
MSPPSSTRWRRVAIAAVVLALSAAACGKSSNGSSSTRRTTTTAMGAGEYGHAGDPAHADTTIDIEALDTLKFDPAAVTVKRGDTVTFKVHNAGQMPHEFVLGTQQVQDEHEREMQASPSMGGGLHDEANAITISAGQTKDLTWTFTALGSVIYGCHEPGHYAAGMKGTVTVT